MAERLTRTEQEIVDSWDRHNSDDVSTGRLFAMVEDDTGADASEIIDAMVKAGRFQPKEAGNG